MSLTVEGIVEELRDPGRRRMLRQAVELYFGAFSSMTDRDVLLTLRAALNRLLEEIE